MTVLVETSWRFLCQLACFQNDLALISCDVWLVAPGHGAYGMSWGKHTRRRRSRVSAEPMLGIPVEAEI